MLKEEIFSNPEKMKILSRIIAHLMGDGCVSKKYFAYYNKNETLLARFKSDVLELFGNVHFITGKVNSGTSFLMIQNKTLFDFLTSIVKDYRSFALKMPKFIDTKDLQKEFLSAIYDDEGCVALRIHKKTNEIKRNITLCSKSQNFLISIKRILEEKFSIKCIKTKNSKNYVYYILSISGKENFVNFKDFINFSHPLKIKKLNMMINSYIRK